MKINNRSATHNDDISGKGVQALEMFDDVWQPTL